MVDVQNDFCAGGALPVPDGDAVVAPVNALMDEVRLVVATRDWHPPDHRSFREQGGRWPVHCVRETPGAQLHSGLRAEAIDVIVDKGTDRELEGYAGCEATDLESRLREHHVDRVHVAGLALDFCVRSTALDARRSGFDVVLHAAATRAIGAALDELRQAGVQVLD